MKTFWKITGPIAGIIAFISICDAAWGGYYEPTVFGVSKDPSKKDSED
jgi:hypothetical protein